MSPRFAGILIAIVVLIGAGCSILSGQRGAPIAQESPSPETLPGKNGWDPTVACAHMSPKLSPGPYKHEGRNIFGCLSSQKNLDAGAPPNNIVYYARGEAGRARQVGLILNVNNPETAQEAQRTLLEYSEELSVKALGVPLSKTATGAILAGNPGRGSVDTTRVEVLRHNFSNGKGFEIHYVITPRL